MSELSIQENVSLAPLTTFKIGGPARHFVSVKTEPELHEALEVSRKNSWPIFILAGGSNLIVSDKGFDGLVINLELGTGDWGLDDNQLTASASLSMRDLVNASIDNGLSGLAWAGGLPGSFGGAIRGNAGCFGSEMKDIVTTVTSINTKTGAKVTRNNADCQFEYRGSYYKYHPEIITLATIQLHPGDKAELRRIADEHIQYRLARQPLEFPNAGSIFKNVPLEQVPKIHLPLFADAIKDDPFPIVPTAKILAVAGLKGMRVGDAQLSEKHSNYIVNLGQAKSSDIVALIDKIKAEIKTRYQIDLEVEPQLVGF
ncbi:MAG: UDP-N-acetylmuramate dehydrogenase [Candidatus Berkelbacteria bacterium]|nr:UDP-N-acetylmuramate dehydrogenase [Candidatus Berkelbacteria bacterium]